MTDMRLLLNQINEAAQVDEFLDQPWRGGDDGGDDGGGGRPRKVLELAAEKMREAGGPDPVSRTDHKFSWHWEAPASEFEEAKTIIWAFAEKTQQGGGLATLSMGMFMNEYIRTTFLLPPSPAAVTIGNMQQKLFDEMKPEKTWFEKADAYLRKKLRELRGKEKDVPPEKMFNVRVDVSIQKKYL